MRPIQTPYPAPSWTLYQQKRLHQPLRHRLRPPIGSIDAALTPAAVSLLTEAGLNDNLDPSAVSALPASALEAVGQVAVGQAAVADDQANSE